MVTRLLAWSHPTSQVRRSHSPRVRRFPRRVRGGKHAEEHEEYRNGSSCQQKERTTPIAPEFTPIRDLVFPSRLVEGLTKDFTPSRTRGNLCFVDQRLFCRTGFWSFRGLFLIFLCHVGPPARCSPRTQWVPMRGGPQPPTPPPATKASRSTACMADDQTLRHRRRVRKVPNGVYSAENPAPVTDRPLTIFRAGSAFPKLFFLRVALVAASTGSRAWSDLRPRTRRPLADLRRSRG